MSSIATQAAEQYRLQQATLMIKECQNRPENMTITEWCKEKGKTKATYYYWHRRVRQAYLEQMAEGGTGQPIVPVPQKLLASNATSPMVSTECIEIISGNLSVRVTESASSKLLSMVLQVLRDVE